MKKLITRYEICLVKEKSSLYEVPGMKVTNPSAVISILNQVCGLHNRAEEVFVLIALTTKNTVAGVFEVSKGSINASIVNPREVFKRAMLVNANKIIVAHNHPSGHVKPSNEDNGVTDRLVQTGNLLGIELLDHIIVNPMDDDYYSYKENGVISN